MDWTSRAVYSTTTIFVACFIEGEKQKEKQSTNLSIKKKQIIFKACVPFGV